MSWYQQTRTSYWRMRFVGLALIGTILIIGSLLHQTLGYIGWLIAIGSGLMVAYAVNNYLDDRYASDQVKLQKQEASRQKQGLESKITLNRDKCPSCNAAIQRGDNHCSNCGYNLEVLKNR